MRCPKCDSKMEEVKEEGITVDRCIGCGGIWFDKWEAEDLIEARYGISVDTGSRVKGMKMDKLRDISCPRCSIKMQTVSDREDPKLKFEVCTDCHGYFLDAGELKDMAHGNTSNDEPKGFFAHVKPFMFGFHATHVHGK